jgi:hypothetical protein
LARGAWGETGRGDRKGAGAENGKWKRADNAKTVRVQRFAEKRKKDAQHKGHTRAKGTGKKEGNKLKD